MTGYLFACCFFNFDFLLDEDDDDDVDDVDDDDEGS